MLDVTDDYSVTAAAKRIEADGGLDVLINNAGIEGRPADGAVVGTPDVTADMMREVFQTNVLASSASPTHFCPYCGAPPRRW